jgi:CheY-like chemotaxis protein
MTPTAPGEFVSRSETGAASDPSAGDPTHVATRPRVLVCCGDLFFGGQLLAVLRQAGCEPVQEFAPQKMVERLRTGGGAAWAGVVIDLETPGVDIADLVVAIRPQGDLRVVAFGPHVHAARLEAARAAGCDAVLSRGQVSSQPALLRGLFAR